MLESSGDFVDKPSFEESLRAEIARRRSGDSHPTAEELVAYRTGDLTPEEDDRIQEHLIQCRECARLLLDLAEFEELSPPPDELGPVDARAEASWQRLRSRIREEEEEAAPPAVLRPRPARVPLWRKPAVPWALAAGLALCVVGLGLRSATLQEQVGDLSGPRVDVPLVDLYPESEQTTRSSGEGQEDLVGGGPFLILHLPEGSPASGVYEMEIVSASGGEPLFEPQRGQEQDGILTVQIPPSLPPGSYRVRLYSLAGSQRQPLDQYSFEISPAAP